MEQDSYICERKNDSQSVNKICILRQLCDLRNDKDSLEKYPNEYNTHFESK